MKTTWHPLFMEGFHFCVCVTKEDIQQVEKDLGIDLNIPADPSYGGAVFSRVHSTRGQVNIIYMPSWKNGDRHQLGLLVHEATHVMQNLMEHIHEEKPSSEFQAYIVQGVFTIAHDSLQERKTKRSKK